MDSIDTIYEQLAGQPEFYRLMRCAGIAEARGCAGTNIRTFACVRHWGTAFELWVAWYAVVRGMPDGEDLLALLIEADVASYATFKSNQRYRDSCGCNGGPPLTFEATVAPALAAERAATARCVDWLRAHGVTDDTGAVDAAVDHTISRHGGDSRGPRLNGEPWAKDVVGPPLTLVERLGRSQAA